MNADETKTLQDSINEISNDVVLGKKIYEESKNVGLKQAFLNHAPEVVGELKKDWAETEAALPIIKSGYKTSEFWVCVAGIAVVVIADALGHPLPWNEDAVIAGLAGAYAIARGFAKKPAA